MRKQKGEVIIKTLKIKTQFYNYNIYLGSSLKLEEFFLDCKHKNLFIITDNNVFNLYEKYLNESFKNFNYNIIKVEAGESSKSFNTYEKIINELLSKGMKKTDLIIAFGGGVVGDLAGYVAGTIFRGVGFINIPTTLLSMADSSIGGKTGIDSSYGKNLIGVYKQPLFVVIDNSFLKTLNKEEYANGMAEIVKAGLIKDKELINYLLKDDVDELKMIYMAIKVKKDIVIKDPYEENIRMLLNFGHTFGHAIEQYHNYEIKHGMCVSMGMDLSVKYGIKISKTKKEVKETLLKLYVKYNLKSFKGDSNIYLKNLKYDKKQKEKNLHFIIINDIGKSEIIKITEEDLNDLSN